jgi:7-cyano-7-deazaguanine synthase
MSPNASHNSSQKAIVLLSGGLDSAMCLVELCEKHDVVLALTVNYGQRAFPKEVQAAKALAAHYGVRHQIVELPWYQDLLPKAMDAQQVFDWAEDGANQGSNDTFFEAKPVWIPNRNGVLLNIAAAFAEACGAQYVAFGANAEEGEAFPDNTEAYRDAVTTALAASTLNGVAVLAPIAQLTKPQMIARAAELNVPIELIWSCYSQAEVHCGECPSCFRLFRAIASCPDESRRLKWENSLGKVLV